MAGYIEHPLADNYPVFFGFLYMVDGTSINSPIEGTVGDLRKALQADTITSCDIAGRKLFDRMVK